MAEGTGLPDQSVGYAMLFNILHAENPGGLRWLGDAGFELLLPDVALPPYHYGIVGRKP